MSIILVPALTYTLCTKGVNLRNNKLVFVFISQMWFSVGEGPYECVQGAGGGFS